MRQKEGLAEKEILKTTLSIRLQPNASRNEVIGVVDEVIKIKVTAPPIEDKANTECLKFLSKLLRIPKSHLNIIKGQKSRSKVIEIKGLSQEVCLDRLISS